MHRSLWFVWAVGLMAALGACGWRWQVERSYRTVALVLDGAEIRTLQGLTGKGLPELLSALNRAGATAVAVAAEQLRDWLLSGWVRLSNGALLSPRRELLEQLRTALQRQFSTALPPPERVDGEWRLPLLNRELPTAPIFVGLDRELADAARQVGLAVVARLPNPPVLTESGVHFWLDEVRSVGAFAIVFDGEEVFGYRTFIPAVANALRNSDWQVGILELVTQKGDRALASQVPEKVLRVHSIGARELVNFTQPELVDRFVRAVRERNIRLCYVRLPFHLKGDPLAVACEYLSTLRGELERNGFSLGVPAPFTPVKMPLWLWLPVSLSITATGIAFLCLFAPLSVRHQWALLSAAFLLGSGLWWLQPLWAMQWAALGIAIVAPVLALWLGMTQTFRNGNRSLRTARGVLTCLGFISACGLLEAAVLFDHRFWLKVSEFVGVKVAQFLPFLLIAGMVMAQWMDTTELPIRDRWLIARTNFRSLWETPVRWGQALLLLSAAALVAYWLMRTGNEPGMGVSAWELKLRHLIEETLGVRPRFKEFLLGHPALVLSFFFLAGTHWEARIGQWLMLPAVIGLASLMNTFSHAHTPLSLSLLRTVHGIWLGVLIGVLLIWAIKRFSASRDRRLQRLAVAERSAPSQTVSSQG